MDSLSKDVLFNIATMLDLDNLLSFCSSSDRINRLVCQDKNIWNFKLISEFPNYKSHINQKGREAYELLISLSKLKVWSNYKGTIYELYKETDLYLYNKVLITLPSEIGNLSKLQELLLNNNQITILPPEIGKLSSLHTLYLDNNQITVLPNEIGKLSNLQALFLDNNKISSLPSEIGNLSKLEHLYLYNNKIEILPPEIGKLSNLKRLLLDRGVKIPPGLKLPVEYVN